MDTRYRKILLDHLMEGSLDQVIEWLERYHVSLTITRKRNTKMGDYRPPVRRNAHRISINGDLHPMAFLVTLIHELAHLVIWEEYQRKVKPHGEEWKNQFRQMLSEIYSLGVFSPDFEDIIQNFIKGKLSYRSFNQQFDKRIHENDHSNTMLLLSEIPFNSSFSIHNGRTFVKMEKLRTRYRCREVKTGRLYLISGLAKVQPEGFQG
jgi:hypothetical protein